MTPESYVENMTASPGLWRCETTQSDGRHLWETDQIEALSSRWLHGRARPDPSKSEPYYDYYLGYVDKHWVYIQIVPANKAYFVALSDGPTLAGKWSIVYPSRLTGYTIYPKIDSFIIDYPDLQQFCQKAPHAVVTPTPVPVTLTCNTWYSGNGDIEAFGPIETLTESKPQNKVAWWQGVASDEHGKIYAYNVFDTGLQRVSILVNASTGKYAVATSYATPNLNSSVWIVRYPVVETGFAFNYVKYITDNPEQYDLPSSFTLIFRDGFQRCARGSVAPDMSTPDPSPTP